MIVPLERLETVLLAGAAGDGIGGSCEGQPLDPERRLPPPPWRLSDDTRMTFATCRGIAASTTIDPAAIASAFVDQFRAGLPGVGSSTLKAMRDLASGQHWALAGARGEFAAGNGAAMRIAPLAFFGDVGEPSFARLVRDIASITHRNDEAIAGAIAVVFGLQRVAAGQTGREVLTALIEQLPDTALSDSLLALAALREDATMFDAARQVGTSGRVAESVALALFIGCSAPAIDIAIHDAVRCGGDTDTIASLAAQIRAASGEQLPAEWLPHLPTDEVRELSASLGRRERATPRRRRWGLF
jgi:ADP-ribosylglycohydrolase